jgi:phosphatidate cytidylyltransferase
LAVVNAVLEAFEMLKHRLFSAAILLSLLSGSLLWEGLPGQLLFLAFATLLVVKGAREFLNMSALIYSKGYTWIAGLCAILPVYGAFFENFVDKKNLSFAGFAATISFLLIGGFSKVLREPDLKTGLLKMTATLACFTYLVIPTWFLAMVYFGCGLDISGDERKLTFFIIAVTKASDVGAYFVGMTSNKLLPGGNHKIAPRLSPGKSWEGFFGGIAFSIGVAFLFLHLSNERLGSCILEFHNGVGRGLNAWDCIIVGSVCAILGFIGDVSESVMKRVSGLKDSGSILPGMGGVLDVLDSLILVSPLFYAYLWFRLPLIH